MPQPTLTPEQLTKALKALGQRVGGYDEIEMLIVGGMAGKLAGVLPPNRQTIDCDIMVYDPETAFGAVEQEAFSIAKEMGLPTKWLNSAAHGYLIYLPSGWEKRRKMLGRFGLLKVYYVDRFDLIALKVLAGRAVDQQDLLTMRVLPQEVAQVRKHLTTLKGRGVSNQTIQAARELLDALEHSP
jgi:hypothetical protein